MLMTKIKKNLIDTGLFLAFFLVFLFLALNFVSAANTGNVVDWAWSEGLGWIHFSGSQSSVDYGVTVGDTGLTGDAWGENTGYISFSGTCDDAGGCPEGGDDYQVLATSTCSVGAQCLSGWAWTENVGWIHFAADGTDYSNDATSTYGVFIDEQGFFDGYAWGEAFGWISFRGACDGDVCPSGDTNYAVHLGEKKVFYSVGQNAFDHKTGTPTMTIENGLATFSTAQTATNMGVGDRVTYGVASSTAYISEKVSTTQWRLVTFLGGLVSDLSVATSVGSIIHEYTSLSSAEAGAGGDNFIGTTSLVSADVQLNFPCYYDTGADTDAVTINGWETSSTTFIKIYTPNDTAKEVNQSQRHSGVWDDGKYRLEVPDSAVLNINESYVRIDGMQINVTFSVGLYTPVFDPSSDIIISNNIIKGSGGFLSTNHYGIAGNSSSKIWNNIVYGFKGTGVNGALKLGGLAGNNYYVYNNTIYDSSYGIERDTGTVFAMNNISQNCTDGYWGTFDATSENNISNVSQADADSVNNSFDGYKIVQFVDATNNDFRLSESDTVARDAGTSTPVIASVSDAIYDIQGTPRGAAWDIGADEVPVDFVSTICEDIDTGGDCANLDYNTLSSWEDAVESDLTADNTKVYGGAITGTLNENDLLTLYRNGSSTEVTGYIVATTSDQILIDGLSHPMTLESSDDLTRFIASTSDQWYIDGSNFWTVSGTGDELGASPRAVAKIDGTWSVADDRVDINGWATDIDNNIKIYTTNTARHKGKWSDTAYRIEHTPTGNYQDLIKNNENYFWVDGLELNSISSGIYSPSGITSNNIDRYNNQIFISNNIIKGDGENASQGISMYDSDSNYRVWGNIVYKMGGSCIYTAMGIGELYAYNNTLYSCDVGISNLTGIALLKNNLSFNNKNLDYLNSFTAGSVNNISSDTTANNYGLTDGYINILAEDVFVSIATGSEDFHLASTDTAAKGAGVSLYDDQYLNVTNDIDSSARPDADSALLWDIGADQTARAIYRSVGPSNTTALADYAGEGALTLSSTTATFASALPDNIGVGDVIQYDSDNTGGIDTLAFIHGRASSTEYTVRTVGGEYLTLASATITTWELYRAYTSLANAEAGIENAGIDTSLRNFDDWTDGGDATTDDVGKDIKTANEQWNIVAYGDAVDTVNVSINGWTTASQNYVKIFTPVGPSEVGISQRHSGVWGSGYKMEVQGSGITRVINFYDNHVRVDGLQISIENNNGDYNAAIGTTNTNHPDSDIYISNNILKAVNPTVYGVYGFISYAEFNVTAWNNIAYNFTTGDGFHPGSTGGGDCYFYNNTAYNNKDGFDPDGGNIILVNNLSVNNSNLDFACVSGCDPGSSHNVSSDDSADNDPDMENSIINATVSFADELNNDFHLHPLDRTAKNAGTSTEEILSLSLQDDIDGHVRDADGQGWDIGADEAANAVFYSVGQVSTDHRTCTGGDCVTTPLTVTIATSGLATFSTAQTSNVFGVGDRIIFGAASTTVYVSEKQDTSNWYVVTATGTTPTNVTDELVGSIIHEYTSLSNAEAGAVDSNHLNTTDLKTNNLQLNFPAYYDDGADEGYLDISGLTTAFPNNIKIYAPNDIDTEVNLSQRHSGIWNDEKFRISQSTEWHNNITSQVDYITLSGLQIDSTVDYVIGIRVYGSGYKNSLINLNNNIIKSPDSVCGSNAIRIEAGTKTVVNNNIIYDYGIGIYAWDWSTDYYLEIYNNTVYNSSEEGIYLGTNNATEIVKNNIVLRSTDEDYRSLDSSNSSNNISSDSTAGSLNNSITNAKVKFLDEKNDDFRLSPKDTVANDAGVDLSTSTTYAFLYDNVGHTRPSAGSGQAGAWDIGASEAATEIFRSVGPGNTNALAIGNATNTLTISGSVATFVESMPLNMGVGDVIQYYDGGGDNSMDYIAFVHGRTTDKIYTVKTATGSVPTAMTADSAWSVFRAYTSLALAESGTENTGIDDTLEAFETYSEAKDIFNSNEQWNITAYGDAEDNTMVNIYGWTTAPQNHIRIYTPFKENEVGVSQRHSGVWDDDKYRLEISATADYQDNITISDGFVRIDGLQMDFITNDYDYTKFVTISDPSNLFTSNESHYFSNNILRGHTSALTNEFFGFYLSSLSTKYLWNNIIYGINDSGSRHEAITSYGTSYLYNNTFYDNRTGIRVIGGTSIAKNNLTNSAYNGFEGSFDPSSDYNISDLASDAPGTNSKNLTTVAFRDTTNNDFRLDPFDTSARNAGVNLQHDPYLWFEYDIEGQARDGSWDIGADEVINVTIMPTAKTEDYDRTVGLEDGLVGYWTFNGPDIDWNTNTILDRSGEYNNGIASGSPKAVNGIHGQAFEFNAEGQAIVIPDDDSLDGMAELTLSAWVKPYSFGQSTPYGRIIGKTNASDYALYLNSNNISCELGADGMTSAGSLMSGKFNQWNNIMCVYDGSLIKIYLNNELISTSSKTTAINSGASPLILGSDNGYDDTWDGGLDEVRIYDRALSATEVGMLYRKGFAVFQSKEHIYHKQGLVGYWSFDGFDMDWASTTAEVIDRSEYANPGNLIGGYKAVRGKIGQGMLFNGVDSYVSILNNLDIKPPLPITLAAWIKTNDATVRQNIITTDEISTYHGVWFQTGTDGKLSLSYGDGGGTQSVDNRRLKVGVSVLQSGEWYFVSAVIIGPTDMNIYINGVDDSGTYSGTGDSLAYTSGDTYIGQAATADNMFDGTIDEVRIYNYALSANEIKSLYQYGKVETRQ
jgi:hypothetical protein